MCVRASQLAGAIENKRKLLGNSFLVDFFERSEEIIVNWLFIRSKQEHFKRSIKIVTTSLQFNAQVHWKILDNVGLYAWWLSVGLWNDARTLKCQMSVFQLWLCSHLSTLCHAVQTSIDAVFQLAWHLMTSESYAIRPSTVSGEWYVFRFYISAHHYMDLISHCNSVRFPRNIWAGLSLHGKLMLSHAHTHTFRKWWKRSRQSRLI